MGGGGGGEGGGALPDFSFLLRRVFIFVALLCRLVCLSRGTIQQNSSEFYGCVP